MKPSSKNLRTIPAAMCLLLAAAAPVAAQDIDSLRADVQNPLRDFVSVPLETAIHFDAPGGTVMVADLQPTIPVELGSFAWINEIHVPLVYNRGLVRGIPEIPQGVLGDDDFGLGDLNYTGLAAPRTDFLTANGRIAWAIGPSVTLATASDRSLGTGKFSAGPEAVILAQPDAWTLGVRIRQLWSFAGDASRAPVDQMLLQPFVSYDLPKDWYVTTRPVVTANWNVPDSQVWTVPIGAGVGRIVRLGAVPVDLRLEGYWYAARPTGAPAGALVVTIAPHFPR